MPRLPLHGALPPGEALWEGEWEGDVGFSVHLASQQWPLGPCAARLLGDTVLGGGQPCSGLQRWWGAVSVCVCVWSLCLCVCVCLCVSVFVGVSGWPLELNLNSGQDGDWLGSREALSWTQSGEARLRPGPSARVRGAWQGTNTGLVFSVFL